METSFQNYCRFYVIIVISIKFRYFYTEIRKKNLFTFFTAILSSIEIFVAIGRCREKYIVSRICALVLLVLLCLYIPGALLRIWTIKERYSIIIDSFAVWRINVSVDNVVHLSREFNLSKSFLPFDSSFSTFRVPCFSMSSPQKAELGFINFLLYYFSDFTDEFARFNYKN